MTEDELYSYDVCTKLVKLHKELKDDHDGCYLWCASLFDLLNDLERVMDKFERDMKGTNAEFGQSHT